MKIRIITVGKIKEKYLKLGIDEYKKRLSRFTKLEIIEVSDEPIPENCSLSQEQQIKDKEAKKVLDKIKDDDFVYVMDLAGEMYSSEKLAKAIELNMVNGKSNIDFVIGGSLGLGEDLIKRSNSRVCLSKMTFTHQMVRLLLVEQLFRSFKIINNEKYHK